MMRATTRSEDDTPRPQTKTKKERDMLTTTPKSAARKPSPVKHTPAASAAAAAAPPRQQQQQQSHQHPAPGNCRSQRRWQNCRTSSTTSVVRTPLILQKPRQGSAVTAKFEQVLLLTRSKVSILHDIEVLQAEYVFHITYEDETTECLEMDLPDDISPSEIQILQSGAATIMKDTSLSRERRAAGRCFYLKLDALLTTTTSKHSKRSAASSKRA